MVGVKEALLTAPLIYHLVSAFRLRRSYSRAQASPRLNSCTYQNSNIHRHMNGAAIWVKEDNKVMSSTTAPHVKGSNLIEGHSTNGDLRLTFRAVYVYLSIQDASPTDSVDRIISTKNAENMKNSSKSSSNESEELELIIK